MVAPGICHVKARLVDLIGSSGIENATSAQPKNLASAPRLSPLRFFGGVAGDETSWWVGSTWLVGEVTWLVGGLVGGWGPLGWWVRSTWLVGGVHLVGG